MSSAAADAVEALGLVPDTDLLQFDSRTKHRRKVADEIPEVDALFGGEIECQLLSVPLPLGVGKFHDESVCLDSLHRAPTCDLVLTSQFGLALRVFARGRAHYPALREGGSQAVGAALAPPTRGESCSVNAPEILATVCIDDHRRTERRRLAQFPDEELATVSLERDLDDFRSGPCENWKCLGGHSVN